MSSDQIASLIYLVLLATAIIGWFIAQNRLSLGRLAQMAVMWGLLFLGVIAAKGLWDDIRRTTVTVAPVTAAQDGTLVLDRARDGHFYATLSLNGVPVTFLVDTGATQIVLDQRDAEHIGLDPDGLVYMGRAQTANGPVRTAYARVETIEIGPYLDRDLTVSVTRSDMGGSLLGMAYLGLFDTLQISGDTMILKR